MSRAKVIVQALLAIAASLMLARAVQAAAPTAADELIRKLDLRVAGQPVRARQGWRTPRIILIPEGMNDRRSELQALAPGAAIVALSSATAADIANADVAIGICAPDVLQRTRQLQWVQLLTAGVESCVRTAWMHDHRPLVTNMQRAAGPSMAEHVMAMMLALSRNLQYFFAAQQRGQWASAAAPESQDLEGKTVLVVGLGGIGLEVARRAHALGMRVIATRASGRTGPDYVSYVGLPDEMLKLAGDADFVVNCTPLTAQTTSIFDRKFFAAMKPKAYFLSVGRGRSTVTADLTSALSQHRIAGAGLDVLDPEPLPADSALWRMPNVLITPHVSGDTAIASDIRWQLLLENLRRYVAGDPMLSVVEVERGY